jgi:hypothetical protein
MKSRIRSIITQSFLLCLSLAFMSAAHAQKVAVTEADPNVAEQDTLNLDVKIKGRGFRTGAAVTFWITGSTTNNGGVTVNSAVVHDSKNLTANIDVPLGATISDYDIEVAVSSSRRGRGTTLFSVKLKGGGNGDTTPPDPIQDFHVLHPTFSTSVTLRWISPGDDGMSGSVDSYSLTKAAQSDLSVCDGPGPYDFDNAQSAPPPPTSPANWIYNYPVEGLTPETCYAFELEAFDEAGNPSGPAVTAAATVSAPIADAWTLELISPPAYAMQLSFDPRTNLPVILGAPTDISRTYFYERSADVDGTWSNDLLIRGADRISLAFNPVSNAYVAVVVKRGQPHLAEQQSDGSWTVNQIVRSSADFSNQAIVFNSAGSAVVAYTVDNVINIARQNGSSFEIEQPNIPEGRFALLRLHPETGDPVLVYRDLDRLTVYIATYDDDSGSWSVEDIVLGAGIGSRINLQAFDYDPNGDPIILFNQELGVPYDYWAHMLRTDEFGEWDPANAKKTDPTGLFNQNIVNMQITGDGTVYVSATNTTNQAKIGKFCEDVVEFSCDPTMDATGMQNVWLWEVAAEGVGQAGRSVAVDELTGTIALITSGSEGNNPDDMHYYECDPSSASVICGSPTVP